LVPPCIPARDALAREQFDIRTSNQTFDPAVNAFRLSGMLAARFDNALSVLTHGPGHHLGSNEIHRAARDFLVPLAEIIDRQQGPLERYQTILHLLHKAALGKGEQPWQDAAILIQLRNEITHYKSQWGQEMERKSLIKSLRELRLERPPFIPANTNFFPHQCLSAACAAWSVRTAVKFFNVFYARLEVRSPLTAYMAQFEGL
jgi:hypothetical protein